MPDTLTVKRLINVKAIVTERWKDDAQKQLQAQLDRLDSRLQQLEMQGQRMVAELQKQGGTTSMERTQQQIGAIENQLNQNKSKLLEQKNQILQQLQQVQTLEMGQEVSQGQIESLFELKQGDNLVEKMRIEILLHDGIVQEIRGEF